MDMNRDYRVERLSELTLRDKPVSIGFSGLQTGYISGRLGGEGAEGQGEGP